MDFRVFVLIAGQKESENGSIVRTVERGWRNNERRSNGLCDI